MKEEKSASFQYTNILFMEKKIVYGTVSIVLTLDTIEGEMEWHFVGIIFTNNFYMDICCKMNCVQQRVADHLV